MPSCPRIPERASPVRDTDLPVAEDASEAGKTPTAGFLLNGNVTCETSLGGEGDDDGSDDESDGDDGETSSSSFISPCSEGSECLDGDLGVYCRCYMRESTLEEVKDPT